jgi:hypothetical protein
LFFFFRVAGVFSCCSNPFLLYCADYPGNQSLLLILTLLAFGLRISFRERK